MPPVSTLNLTSTSICTPRAASVLTHEHNTLIECSVSHCTYARSTHLDVCQRVCTAHRSLSPLVPTLNLSSLRPLSALRVQRAHTSTTPSVSLTAHTCAQRTSTCVNARALCLHSARKLAHTSTTLLPLTARTCQRACTAHRARPIAFSPLVSILNLNSTSRSTRTPIVCSHEHDTLSVSHRTHVRSTHLDVCQRACTCTAHRPFSFFTPLNLSISTRSLSTSTPRATCLHRARHSQFSHCTRVRSTNLDRAM